MSDDQFARWRAAVGGGKLELGERGNAPSGYYRIMPWKTSRDQRQNAMEVWRDEAGDVCVWRQFYADNKKKMTALEIDDLFMGEVYAVPHDVYLAATAPNGGWPEEYTTGLTTKEIKEGVHWTLELSRAKLAAAKMGKPTTLAGSALAATDDGPAANERAVIGNNNPPEPTPHESIRLRIKKLGEELVTASATWGAVPKTKEHADAAADFAVAFKGLETEALALHKVEKQPILDAQRECDGRWFALSNEAKTERTTALGFSAAYIAAERAKAEIAAKAANDAARREAARVAEIAGSAIAPIVEVTAAPVRVGTGKAVKMTTRKFWAVKNIKAFAAYLAAMEPAPSDFAAMCQTIANRMGSAGVSNLPGVELEHRQSVS